MINYFHIRYINYLENYQKRRKRKKKIIVKTSCVDSLNKIFWIAITFDRNYRSLVCRQQNANRAGCCFWRTQKEVAGNFSPPKCKCGHCALTPMDRFFLKLSPAWQCCSVQPKTVNSQRFWTLGLEGLIFFLAQHLKPMSCCFPCLLSEQQNFTVTAMRATVTELLFFGGWTSFLNFTPF